MAIIVWGGGKSLLGKFCGTLRNCRWSSVARAGRWSLGEIGVLQYSGWRAELHGEA